MTKSELLAQADARKLCTCNGAGRGPGRACVVLAGERLGELWRCANGHTPAAVIEAPVPVAYASPAWLLGTGRCIRHLGQRSILEAREDMKFTPLYTAPIDQSARISEQEQLLRDLETRLKSALSESEGLRTACGTYIAERDALDEQQAQASARLAAQMSEPKNDAAPGAVLSTAGFGVWIPIAERLPVSGKPVLVACGKKALRAAHAAKFELDEEDWGLFNDGEGADYDEATDATYWPEGWYEWNDSEEIHWMIHDPVTHWMPLPTTPNAEFTERRQASGGMPGSAT